MEKGIEPEGRDTERELSFLIRERFGEPHNELRALSPLTLAFVGDAVWALLVSNVVVNRGNAGGAKLHSRTAAYVSAKAQSEIATYLQDEGLLLDEERDILRRGINARPRTHAKNASHNQYHRATGLEALVGYLYLKGQTDRVIELLDAGIRLIDDKKKEA